MRMMTISFRSQSPETLAGIAKIFGFAWGRLHCIHSAFLTYTHGQLCEICLRSLEGARERERESHDDGCLLIINTRDCRPDPRPSTGNGATVAADEQEIIAICCENIIRADVGLFLLLRLLR